MATMQDLLQLLPGTKVVITSCEAAEHGNNAGCLCAMIGETHIVGDRYETVFAGTPTWWITGDRRVRLSEITILRRTKE